MAVEPKTKADQEKLASALQRLSEEDPDLRGQDRRGNRPDDHLRHGRAPPRDHRDRMLPRVQGRGQRRHAADRLPRDDHQGRPTAKASSSSSPAAAANTATSSSTMTPEREGQGPDDREQDRRRHDPEGITSTPCCKGVKEAMTNGIIAGYPVIDVHVDILDGSYHEVDSNENAFKMAAIFAMKDGFKKAKSDPARADHDGRGHHPGRVPGRHHGRPQPPPRPDPAASSPRATSPSSTPTSRSTEMFGYSTAIRTLSSGRASYSMKPSHFEQVPQQHRRGNRQRTLG